MKMSQMWVGYPYVRVFIIVRCSLSHVCSHVNAREFQMQVDFKFHALIDHICEIFTCVRNSYGRNVQLCEITNVVNCQACRIVVCVRFGRGAERARENEKDRERESMREREREKGRENTRRKPGTRSHRIPV